MRTHFWIEPALVEHARQEVAEDFEYWMNGGLGELVSSVRGSEVRRVWIAGERYYLKRRRGEPPARLLGLLLYGKKPMSAPMREFRMLRELAKAGFRVMVPVAWGEARWAGIPREGFLLVKEVTGQSLLEAYRDGSSSNRDKLMRKLGWLTGRLHSSGFFDHLRLKDLIVEGDGELTMIDRESRHPWPRRFSEKTAITALARTARRTFRDGDRMGARTGFEFFEGYRDGVAERWKIEGCELRKRFFCEFRRELARYPDRSLW